MPLRVTRRKDTGSLTIDGTVAGQRIRRRAQSNNLALAREEAALFETEILRQSYHGERRGSRSFAEAVVSYTQAAPRAAGDLKRLNRILLALGDAPLSAVDQDAIYRVRSAILKPDASPATIRRGIIVPIRAVMMHAARRKWCDVPMFEAPPQTPGRTLFLLPDEAERLIVAAAPHLQPLLLFLLGTGARMSEALELEWRDVDLVGGRAIFWRTKNDNRRVADIPPRATDALTLLREEHSRTDRVFTTGSGNGYCYNNRQYGGQIKTAWAGARKRAGLNQDLTPHDLRHTWASWHYALHRDLLALKEAGGWSSVTLVERYSHLLPAGQEEAIRQFMNGHAGDTGVAVTKLRA